MLCEKFGWYVFSSYMIDIRVLFDVGRFLEAGAPLLFVREKEQTRLGLQCQTPLRSYPLSLNPYPLSLPLVPYPLVLFLSQNLGEGLL